MSDQGTVKMFSDVRGWGFIQPDVMGDADVFVHASALTNCSALEPGDRVEYRVIMGDRGKLKASDVRRIL